MLHDKYKFDNDLTLFLAEQMLNRLEVGSSFFFHAAIPSVLDPAFQRICASECEARQLLFASGQEGRHCGAYD